MQMTKTTHSKMTHLRFLFLQRELTISKPDIIWVERDNIICRVTAPKTFVKSQRLFIHVVKAKEIERAEDFLLGKLGHKFMHTCSLPSAFYHITILFFIGRTYISVCYVDETSYSTF